MFAVIKSGGRQYKVSVGEKLEVNRLPYEDGKQIEIGEVLLISDADNSFVGAPFVEGAKVLATVERQARGEKLIVFKYKSKKRYRHRRGHRQELTILSIDDIISNGKSLITGEKPEAKDENSSPVEKAEVVETQPAAEEQPVEEKKPRRRRTTKKAQEAESSTEE